MPRTLRPTLEAFKRAGWYPATQEIYDTFMHDLSTGMYKTLKQGDDELLPSILEFKKFVKSNPTVYEEFIRMFEQTDKGESPHDFAELLHLYNTIFREAPYYGDLGPPMYMIMNRIMNTQGGFSAFTKEVLNEEYKKLFKSWTVYLSSQASTYVLTDKRIDAGHVGWFHPDARKALMELFPPGKEPKRSFEEVFLCTPGAPALGYHSFDEFFNRRFRNVAVDRPIATDQIVIQQIDPVTGLPVVPPYADTSIVGAPCEATTYNVSHHVKLEDTLFIKDEAYSLEQLLFNDPLTKEFEDGSVIQGFLNTTGYHRWHSPVNGKILKVVDVQGSYFNQAPNTLTSIIPSVDSKELPPYLKSLRYFAHTNTRQLIFIEPDNEKVGLLCFIAIGMTEISTCQNTVVPFQHVNRGDELGMFHFGGSSFALVFTAKSKAEILPKFEFFEDGKATPILINEKLAKVRDSDEQ